MLAHIRPYPQELKCSRSAGIGCEDHCAYACWAYCGEGVCGASNEKSFIVGVVSSKGLWKGQGVCKKKTQYTRSFYLDKVSQTLPPLTLLKKEINHVFNL